MGNKEFPDLGEAEVRLGLLENVEELVHWGGRVSQESQGRREALETVDLAGRREMTAEMGLAVKDAEAKKEREASLGIRDQRVPLVSQGQMDHQDPKASEVEGEIQDLQE